MEFQQAGHQQPYHQPPYQPPQAAAPGYQQPARRSSPKPSVEVLKKPTSIVSIINSVACIVLALVATACAAVLLSDLDFPDLSGTDSDILNNVEKNRTLTRAAAAFVIIATVATLVVKVLLIVRVVLNFGFAQRYGIAVLIFEAAGGLVCALLFFGVAVALAVYSGEWLEFKELLEELAPQIDGVDAPALLQLFNLDTIVPVVGAASAFGFFSALALFFSVVWSVIAVLIARKQ